MFSHNGRSHVLKGKPLNYSVESVIQYQRVWHGASYVVITSNYDRNVVHADPYYSFHP